VTVAWYASGMCAGNIMSAAWSTMSHCRRPSDWSFALDTLEVAAQFYYGGRLR
jgi:hypothetical protein